MFQTTNQFLHELSYNSYQSHEITIFLLIFPMKSAISSSWPTTRGLVQEFQSPEVGRQITSDHPTFGGKISGKTMGKCIFLDFQPREMMI